jgi:hypothetical protein
MGKSQNSWYLPQICTELKSDNGFGFSIIENPYFDYLIGPNSAGMRLMETWYELMGVPCSRTLCTMEHGT